MTRRFAPRLLLVLWSASLFAACGGGGGGGGGPPPEQLVRRLDPGQGIRVMQVDFYLDLNTVLDSTWGRLRIDPELIAGNLGEEGGFVNVVTETGWAVVNMPVPPPSEPPLVTYFHLDVEEGDGVDSVMVGVQHSRYPIADITSWAGDFSIYEVEDWASGKGGVSTEPTEDPGLPPRTVPIGNVAPVGKETFSHWQSVTNVQCAYDQCLPMAVANCLQFLENGVHIAVPHNHVPGLWGDNTLVGRLDADFQRWAPSRTTGDGSWFTEAVDGTFQYLQDYGQKSYLTYRHQDRGWGTPGTQALPGGNYTKNGSTSVDDGALATWDWIDQRVQNGCGIVAAYYWGSGGHAVRITGSGRIGGHPWVRHSHDDLQTHQDPTDSKGLETVWNYLVDWDDDGQINLGGASQELEWVWALCP